jgi:hypothetical protein
MAVDPHASPAKRIRYRVLFVEEIVERIERVSAGVVRSGFPDGEIRRIQPVGQLLCDRGNLVTFVLDSLSIHVYGDGLPACVAKEA